MEIIAYEMKYVKYDIEKSNILCIPFEQKYFQQYMKIYNTCFYEMRKSLAIEPYNFLNDYLRPLSRFGERGLLSFLDEILKEI